VAGFPHAESISALRGRAIWKRRRSFFKTNPRQRSDRRRKTPQGLQIFQAISQSTPFQDEGIFEGLHKPQEFRSLRDAAVVALASKNSISCRAAQWGSRYRGGIPALNLQEELAHVTPSLHKLMCLNHLLQGEDPEHVGAEAAGLEEWP
jgi:hypothetical protein